MFQMAKQEQIIIPVSLQERVEDILDGLPKKGRVFRMTWKKSVVLAAAMICMFSITVTAAVNTWRQRMEAMNEKEMEAYFVQLYTTRIGADNYNRPYTETEKARMEELKKDYEEAALFPEAALKMIAGPDEYKGKGVGFPENEMSDEELLQIIDFLHKRDYSIQAMNEKIGAGEIDFPEDEIAGKEQEIEATDENILQSSAVYEPEQELTIPYTGELSIRNMAMGQNCIFLTGWNAIHTMEIGSSDSKLFFDDFDTKTDVTALYQDKKGDIYIALMELTEGEEHCAIVKSTKSRSGY